MKDLEARKRHIETELARAIEEERVRGFRFVLGGHLLADPCGVVRCCSHRCVVCFVFL